MTFIKIKMFFAKIFRFIPCEMQKIFIKCNKKRFYKYCRGEKEKKIGKLSAKKKERKKYS